uniref:Uncharacterized protein n=1 Tax=Panagrolaimus davidi TaxID=227884 RepID=A0A914P2S9_9BILA
MSSAVVCHNQLFLHLKSFLRTKNFAIKQQQLQIFEYCSCIKFLNIVQPVDYGLGTVAERIEEYTKRFGHDFSESQRILHCFDDLSVDDKKSIIESSNKILSILKPYICQKFEIGLPSNVYDKRQEIIEQKDVEALEGAFVPTNSSSVTLAYFHRLFLTDRMTLLSGSNAKVSDMEQMISRWIKIIDVLEKYFVEESEQILICQNFFEQIIASSNAYKNVYRRIVQV